jgi:protein SCO1/2
MRRRRSSPTAGPHRRALALALASCALAALAGPAVAQTADLARREVGAVGVVERLGARVPREAVLTEAGGTRTTLAALGGRPVLLSFNYTSCRRLCGLQLAGLARALRELGWAGERFAVATVSIDPAEELPRLGRYKRERVREAGGGPGVEAGWRFLVAGKEDVAALAEAVGFRYRYDPASGEFAHQATLVVLTGDGRVSGYLHGIGYTPAALRQALERAEAGRVASAAEQRSLGGFLLSCIGLAPGDPAPRALRVMRAGGIAALLFLATFLSTLALRGARRRRMGSARDAPPA